MMNLRKLLTTPALLSLELAAFAVQPIKEMRSEYIDYVPSEFGYEGKSSFFFMLQGDEVTDFERFNSELETVEKLSITNKIYSRVTKYLIPSGTRYAYHFIKESWGSVLSYSELIKKVESLYRNGYISVKMSHVYDGGNAEVFFPGKTLPQGIKDGVSNDELSRAAELGYLDNIDGYIIYSPYGNDERYFEIFKREMSDNKVFDWSSPMKEVSVKTEDFAALPFDYVYYRCESNADGFEVNITQTMFNADKDYEVLCPILRESSTPFTKEVRNSYSPLVYTEETANGVEDRSTSNWNEEIYSLEYVGAAVINLTSGEVVASFEFPNPSIIKSDWIRFCDPTIYRFDDNYYLSLEEQINEEEGRAYFFLIEKGMSGVQSPIIYKTVKVHPTIVSRGTDVEVSSDDAISAITLSGINGQTEQRITGRGRRSHAVKTDHLSSGVHIVGVQTEDGSQSVSKIIVK